MALDQRQLRAFLAVADCGSLGRAAGTVGLSQPALSRMIQSMEIRLGAKLFERHSAGMQLTAYGDALLPHARLLLFEMNQAVESIDALRGLRRGTARIGAVATITRSILPGAVDRLLAAAPGIHVELLEAADDRLVTALTRREVDVMIAGELAPAEDVMAVAECRFDDRYEVFCAASHPLARREMVSLADVMRESWIMPMRGATPRELFEEQVEAAGAQPPKVAVETWSPSAMLAFVSQTNLLGWLPRPLFADNEAAGLVRRLDVPPLTISRRFFVYRRMRGLLPVAVVRFVQELPLVETANEQLLIFGQGAAV